MRLLSSITASGILLASASALGAEAPATRPWEFLGWRFFAENDFFADGGDLDYTNGLEVQFWYAGPDAQGSTGSKLERAIRSWCSDPPCISDVGFALGQTFYTPEDIADPQPQLNDRPWAGYLFASTTLAISSRSRQHTLEAQVGVVGPSSGAKWIQVNWHQLTDDTHPAGWANQIPDQPAFELLYSYRYRTGGSHADAIMLLGGAVGTVQDYVNAGVTLRAGSKLSGFGKTRIPATVALSSVSEGRSEERLVRQPSGPHVFLSAEGRWVPFNTFLRGGTFRRTPTDIEPTPLVWDLSIGGAIPVSFSRRWSIAYEYVHRSEEFDGGGSHNFGSLVLSYTSKNVLPKQ